CLKVVTRRILEVLSVIKLLPDSKSPILCFVGAPGFGKTSLGRSIARAMSRHFERLSLGGMRDEAELRGHRRTYIGAMPGRIIQALRRVAVNNPVMMLDEVDKLGNDYRGDPSAALLEILDPQQNNTFRDNYLDLPFDLLTSRYTREAGVRQLERTIGNLARKVALRVAEGSTDKVTITAKDVKGYLGGPRFFPEEARTDLPAGVATGMAWTEMGGEVL